MDMSRFNYGDFKERTLQELYPTYGHNIIARHLLYQDNKEENNLKKSLNSLSISSSKFQI